MITRIFLRSYKGRFQWSNIERVEESFTKKLVDSLTDGLVWAVGKSITMDGFEREEIGVYALLRCVSSYSSFQRVLI